MRKDDMIRQLLSRLESDCYKITRTELDQALNAEWQRLSVQTYSEVAELYYMTA